MPNALRLGESYAVNDSFVVQHIGVGMTPPVFLSFFPSVRAIRCTKDIRVY